MRQKCDCQFIRCTCVKLNSELMLLGMSVSGKCFNIEYSIWWTEILRDKGLKFCEKLSANGMRRRKLIMQQFVLNMFRDRNGQVSSFSLVGPNLCMLNTLS